MWITWPLPDLRSKRQDSLNNDGTLNSSEKIKKPCVHPTADVKLITLSLKFSDVQRQLEAWKPPISADQLWSLLWTSRWYYYTLIHKITFIENMHHVHRSKADNIKLWQKEIMSTPPLVRVFVLLIGGHKEREKAKRKRRTKEEENAGLGDSVAEKEENFSKDVKKKAKRHRIVVLEDNNIQEEAKNCSPACTRRSNSRQDSQPTLQNLQHRWEDRSPCIAESIGTCYPCELIYDYGVDGSQSLFHFFKSLLYKKELLVCIIATFWLNFTKYF